MPGKKALLLFAMNKNALRVAAACLVALDAGVAVGMPLAEARVVVGEDVQVIEHDPTVDAERLRELAIVCRRFSPVCGVDESGDGLLLDIAGCGHLFGDVIGLSEAAVTSLTELGFQVKAGLGATVGQAWASARYDLGSDSNDDLPVAALRVEPRVVTGLADFDLKTIGQLRRLPREQLPSRFGGDLLRRLDQFFGVVPEPIEPVLPTEPLRVTWSTEYPLRRSDLVGDVLERLLGELVGKLPDGVGVAELVVSIHAESARLPVEVALAGPTQEAARLLELTALRLERIALPAGVERISVEATGLDLIQKSQTDLFGDPLDGETDREWNELVEQLTGRLGADRVSYTRLTPDPLPERAVEWSPAIEGPQQRTDERTPPPLFTRPMVLLPKPVHLAVWVFKDRPFRVELNGHTLDVVQVWGPERIEAGWWRAATGGEDGQDERRDYYRLELTDGQCLWAFWNAADEGWWIHGFL